MTDKKELLRRYERAKERKEAAQLEARKEAAEMHRIVRELHGIPLGTRWRLRIRTRFFNGVKEYDALLEDIRPISALSDPLTKPWATAFRFKNDGTPEKQVRSVYTDWDVVGPYEEPK